MAVADAEAHLAKVIRLLKAAGVDFPGIRNMKFGRIDPLTGAALIHAEGEWLNGMGEERRVAVSLGPEVGNVAAMQVEDAIRSANRAGYDDVVFAGFGFEAAAPDAIESASHPKLRLHMALIRPDVVMDDLLKTPPGSQLFIVFSAPRVKGPMRRGGGGGGGGMPSLFQYRNEPEGGRFEGVSGGSGSDSGLLSREVRTGRGSQVVVGPVELVGERRESVGKAPGNAQALSGVMSTRPEGLAPVRRTRPQIHRTAPAAPLGEPCLRRASRSPLARCGPPSWGRGGKRRPR